MGKNESSKKKILFAVSEAVPLIKTGGLADVAGSLPSAMDRRKFDCRLILPLYETVKREYREKLVYQYDFRVPFGNTDKYAGVFAMELDGVRLFLIDNEEFFSGQPYEGGQKDIAKFIYFDRAVSVFLKTNGWKPDVVHCHDWQTGLLPPILDFLRRTDDFYREIRTVYTIHNLKFQGVWDLGEIKYLSGLPDEYFGVQGLEYYGAANMMKGGILWADAVTTVSETYAKEILTPEYGEGLDGLLREQSFKLTGILNGIDTQLYDPSADELICARYSLKDVKKKKRENKELLQKELGLKADPDAFMAGIVTRLTDQKGIDLLCGILDRLMETGMQLVVVGTGDRVYEKKLLEAGERYRGRLAAELRFSENAAHKTYAASDIYLMPSRFEPCGLSQLIALRYGSLPVVRETGGLKDTVIPYNRYTGEGTGFSFAGYDAGEFLDCILRAKETNEQESENWKQLVKQAMRADFSWKASALRYQELYLSLFEMDK